jgi:hypothetical protein
LIQFALPTPVPIKDLGLESLTATRHFQVFDQPKVRRQITGVVTIAPITPVAYTLIAPSAHERIELFLQDRLDGLAHSFSNALFEHSMKVNLTNDVTFGILGCRSHRILLGWLIPNKGYLAFNFTQNPLYGPF